MRYARKDPGGVWPRLVIDATGNAGTHAFIVVDGPNSVHIADRDEMSRVLRIAAGAP